MMCEFYNKNQYTASKSSYQRNFHENLKRKNIYFDTLSKSRFSLCPRGSAPSSLRFWESLKCGAIPILISDDWILPEYDWDTCIIRISEENWISNTNPYYIDEIISSIKLDDEISMRESGIKAYNKLSVNMKDYILERL
jgi:hypothetical protein